jgi:hypothetical protein
METEYNEKSKAAMSYQDFNNSKMAMNQKSVGFSRNALKGAGMATVSGTQSVGLLSHSGGGGGLFGSISKPPPVDIGFNPRFTVPDIFATKNEAAKKCKSGAYFPPKDPKFRDEFDVPMNGIDFQLQIKTLQAYNANNLSEHNTKPILYQMREEKERFMQEYRRR